MTVSTPAVKTPPVSWLGAAVDAVTPSFLKSSRKKVTFGPPVDPNGPLVEEAGVIDPNGPPIEATVVAQDPPNLLANIDINQAE